MIALARKYRPKQFADLIVQEHIAAALRGAVAGGRVAHGYLFAGPRGVGKTTAARILAMALNCERRGSGTAAQPFDFRRIGPHVTVDRLRHVVRAGGLSADDEALHLIAKSADGGMRDGLSILDQVVSFGEGPVTAARVREVLGLISDDVYGELLRLVSERDPKAVFPLVERLVDAGADLGEFVAGAGEIVRAVLLAGLGGEPEGLTDVMKALIEKHRSLLPAPDVVRLLSVLTELEPQLRSSGNARLAVELLLLRWAMMSRTVELEAVIRALGKNPVEKPVERPGKGEGAGSGGTPVLRDAAPPTRSPIPPSPAASPAGSPARTPERGPLTTARPRGLLPRAIVDAPAQSPRLGAPP